MEQCIRPNWCNEWTIRISTSDLGISTNGWKRYQLHQTRSDMNIVLTHTENLSTSDRYKVTESYQELIDTSFRDEQSRMSGNHTSAIQDLLTVKGQSSKED